jgi:hypothetical protein
MLKLLQAFIDVAFWRKGPQHLPPSALLMGLTCVAYLGLAIATSGAVGQLADVPADQAIAAPRIIDVVVWLALTLGWVAVMLLLVRRPKRFVQTVTAVVGTGIVIEPIALVVYALLARAGASFIAVPIFLALLCWYVLAIAHIFASSLEMPMLIAVLLSFGFFLVRILVTYQLAPGP